MIAVLGATGNTGRALVAALTAKGAAFKCVVRELDRAAGLLGGDVALVAGDLAQPDGLEAAFPGADKLFRLSGHSPAMKVEQTAAIEAAKAAGIEYIVKVSGADSGIRPDSPADIPRMHWEIEQEIVKSGLAHTLLRPGFFVQNLMMMAPMIAEQGKLITPVPGDVDIAMIDVRDTAAVAARTLTEGGHAGRCYLLNGEPVTYGGVARELGRQPGRNVPFVRVPKQAVLDVMRERALPDCLIDNMAHMIDFQADGSLRGDSDTLRGLLGVRRGRYPRSFPSIRRLSVGSRRTPDPTGQRKGPRIVIELAVDIGSSVVLNLAEHRFGFNWTILGWADGICR